MRRRILAALGSDLPAGCRRVKYLQSSGTQYLTLGVMAYSDEVIKMDVQPLIDPGGWITGVSLFGRRGAASNYNVSAFYAYYNGNYLTTVDFNSSNYSTYRASGGDGNIWQRMTITTGRSLRKVAKSDGAVVAENTVYCSDTIIDYKFGILHHFGDYERNMKNGIVKLYSFEYGDKRKMIPVVKRVGTTDTAYLYDKVTKALFPNVGTGTFGWEEIDGTIVSPT